MIRILSLLDLGLSVIQQAISTGINDVFRGWEEELDPKNLSLLSILKFRAKKRKLSSDIHSEHFFNLEIFGACW